MITPAPQPTAYRISRRGAHWPWRVRGQNPRTGKWDVMCTCESREQAEALVRNWLRTVEGREKS